MLNSPHDLISRDDLIGQFVEQMRYDNATVFLGAGMSVDCGMPSWAELMQPIFKKFNIDISKSDAFLKYDFYDLAEKYLIFNSTRTTLNNMLYDKLSVPLEPSVNHKILARLPLTRLWTTNFDTIIEEAYHPKRSGKKLYAIRKDHDFTIATKENVKLYKAHGCITDVGNIVITKSDLYAYPTKYEIMQNAFSTALAEYTFLFLGFSFEDVNFDAIINRIKNRWGGSTKEHFAVIKRPDRADNIEKQRDNEFAFHLLISKLSSVGIKTLIIDDFIEISLLLKDIEKTWFRRNIFLSGSFDKHFHDKHVSENIQFEYMGKSCYVPYDDIKPDKSTVDEKGTNCLVLK